MELAAARNMIHFNQLKLVAAAVCALTLVLGPNVSGATLPAGPVMAKISIGANGLGFVQHGRRFGSADELTSLNHLIDMALGTRQGLGGQIYTRSTNDFGPLLAATSADSTSGDATTIDLGTGGVYAYLFASYGRANHRYWCGIWYVGNLSGSITIPLTAGRYSLSGWTLFAPGGAVPDGGGTELLLGIALGVLGVVRHRLLSR
jgi:hypothetical protein